MQQAKSTHEMDGFAEASMPSRDDSTSMEQALSETYKLINRLDQAGRTELTIPLRQLVEQMWERGSAGFPNPFVFRRLEKKTLQAWAEHLATPEPATPAMPERYEMFGGKIHGFHHNSPMVGRFYIGSIDETSYAIGMSVRSFNAGDVEHYRALLDIEGGDDLASDEREIILQRRHDTVGIFFRTYEISALGVPCELTRRFMFHSAVEVDDTLRFADRAARGLFSERLAARAGENNSPEAHELVRIVANDGALAALQRAGLDASADCREARALMKNFGLTRGEMINYVREAKGQLAEACFTPGMTIQKLGERAAGFWQELEKLLSGYYPGVKTAKP